MWKGREEKHRLRVGKKEVRASSNQVSVGEEGRKSLKPATVAEARHSKLTGHCTDCSSGTKSMNTGMLC